MEKTPDQIINDIGMLIYGRTDFKKFMAADLGIGRATLDRYLISTELPPKFLTSLRGLCAIKAREKIVQSEMLQELISEI